MVPNLRDLRQGFLQKLKSQISLLSFYEFGDLKQIIWRCCFVFWWHVATRLLVWNHRLRGWQKFFEVVIMDPFATDWAVRNCCPVSRRKRIDTIKLCPTFKVGHSFGPEKTVAFLFFWESTCWPSCAWKILLGRFCCAAQTQLCFSRLATCFFSEAFAVAFQCLRPLPPFAGG